MDTPNEICRAYRLAKDREKQIQIMAELNAVSREENDKNTGARWRDSE